MKMHQVIHDNKIAVSEQIEEEESDSVSGSSSISSSSNSKCSLSFESSMVSSTENIGPSVSNATGTADRVGEVDLSPEKSSISAEEMNDKSLTLEENGGVFNDILVKIKAMKKAQAKE